MSIDLRHKKIEAEIIGAICSECEQGYLMHHGTPLKTNPKQWLHKCTNCDHEAYFTKPYSFIVYQDKEFGPMDAIRYEIEEKDMTHGNG